MTDITTWAGRLLPFAVVAGLAMIFYLLDVFSVRPGFDAEPAKVAARQISVATPRRTNAPSPTPSAAFPTPTANLSAPAGVPPPPVAQPQLPATSSGARTAGEMPPPRESPAAMPPPAAPAAGQGGVESSAPRYVPPAGSPGQPLASEANSTAPVQLPNDEIPQDEGESVDSETLQALDQAEQAASQAGATEQER